MAKRGTEKNPAVVRVQSFSRSEEIMALCEEKGWKVIVGIEPDKPEDISDVQKLMNPPKPIVFHKTKKAKHSKNAPCPCGSGEKYKKCCMNKDLEEV